MFYSLAGNAWGTENTGNMSVFDTIHISNTHSIWDSVLRIPSVITSRILMYNPPNKCTAGTRSNSGGNRWYWQYSGVLCCGYYVVFWPLRSYCKCLSKFNVISKNALEEWTILRASVQSWSMCYSYVTAVVRVCPPVATAAAARVRVLRVSQKASEPLINVHNCDTS